MTGRFCAWMVACALGALAGCSSTPVEPPENLPPTLVTRTSDSTVWTTAEAEAAAKAAAAAAANAPRTRPGGPAAGRPATGTGQAAGGTTAGAAGRPAAGGATGSGAAGGPGSAPGAAVVEVAPARLVYFDFDRYEIKPEFGTAIEALAKQLVADRGQRIVIEGHADERGGAEYNLALGQKRAHAVAQALRLLGVSEVQVEAVSFGDTRPAARGTCRSWVLDR